MNGAGVCFENPCGKPDAPSLKHPKHTANWLPEVSTPMVISLEEKCDNNSGRQDSAVANPVAVTLRKTRRRENLRLLPCRCGFYRNREATMIRKVSPAPNMAGPTFFGEAAKPCF